MFKNATLFLLVCLSVLFSPITAYEATTNANRYTFESVKYDLLDVVLVKDYYYFHLLLVADKQHHRVAAYFLDEMPDVLDLDLLVQVLDPIPFQYIEFYFGNFVVEEASYGFLLD